MAEGGKRVVGLWKVNKALKPLFDVSEFDSVAIWPPGWECSREKKVKRVGKPTTPKKTNIRW